MLRWQLFQHVEPDNGSLLAYIDAYAGPDCQAAWFPASQAVSNQLSLKAFERLEMVNVKSYYQCRRYIASRVIRGPQVDMPCVILQHWDYPEALVRTPIRRIEVTVSLSRDPNAVHNDTVATCDVEYRGTGFQLTHRLCGWEANPRLLFDKLIHDLRLCKRFTKPELDDVVMRFAGGHGPTLNKHPTKTLSEVMGFAGNPLPPAAAPPPPAAPVQALGPLALAENDGWHIPTSDEDDDGEH